MEGESTVAIIVKAAPVIGKKHGETVCVAGIDYEGNWHRLYPVPFRDLDKGQQFRRWDLVRFSWRRPKDDKRPESKNINSQSLKLVGAVPKRERHAFARRALVSSLDKVKADGRSFALIRPESPEFIIKTLNQSELAEEREKRAALHAQDDLFSVPVASLEPPPVTFSYSFHFDGRLRTHRCIDWETEAAFLRRRDERDEAFALRWMQEKFGEEYPRLGMAFAMGTHRVEVFGNWLLSGILRVNEDAQAQLL